MSISKFYDNGGYGGMRYFMSDRDIHLWDEEIDIKVTFLPVRQLGATICIFTSKKEIWYKELEEGLKLLRGKHKYIVRFLVEKQESIIESLAS